MKNILPLFLSFILCATGANGQTTVKGSGYILTQQREVPIYNSIEIKGHLDVFISPDELRPVIIEADNNLFPYIKTEIKKDTLKIFLTDSVYIEKYTAMNIFLSVPHISSIKASAGAHIDGSHLPWKNRQTTINAENQAEVKWHTITQTLNINGQENADIKLKGSAKELNLFLSQSSQLDGEALEVENANLTLSDKAQAKMDISKTIRYDLSQKSKLVYTGSPRILQAYLLSGARIMKKGQGAHRQ